MLQQQQQQRELQQQLQQGHSSGLTPVSAGGQQVPTLRRRGGVALAPAPLPKLHTSRGDGEDEPYHREQQPSRTPGSGAGAGVPTLSYQGEDTIRLPPPASAASASLHPEFGRGDEGDNLPADAQSGGDGGAEHGRQSVTGTELDDDGMLEDFEEGGDEGVQDDEGEDDDDDAAISEAESFTLKDRQEAINVTHPFGIRIWKPALYKKDRSVQKTAEGDIRSSPGGHVSPWLLLFNIIWTLLFGWWLACFALWGALLCVFFYGSPSARAYGKVLYGLAGYLFYPFGKFVRLVQDEAYLDEDQGEGRSISEYEQWQSGDLEYGRLFFGPERSRSIIGRSRRSIDSIPSETDSLLGRRSRRGTPGGIGSPNEPGSGARTKRRFFGRGQWNVGRVLFYSVFYALLTPGLLLVSLLCFFMVFWIPMGKVTALLWRHLRRHPLALEFESDLSPVRTARTPPSSILVCTYKAVGLKYWKYTIDGTNIFLFNLMAVVFFVVFDWVVLVGILDLHVFITSNGFLFVMGLFSIIPLAYFIGQAVASISAQSSMGVGAATNAFFSTIVEVFLYCVALRDGKAQLVEGSVIGSIFAGILFLPGVSMCFGAIKRKTQRFNAQSAGVTSTMLLFAVIGAFGPTLFYQIYGTHQLNCRDCVAYSEPRQPDTTDRDCKRCFFSQSPALDERFYIEAVRPYCYLAAGMLFLSYVIGLWFTLRTHAAVIWVQDTVDEKKHDDHEVSHPQPQHHIVRSPPLSASAPRLPTPTGPPAGGTGAGRVVSHQSSTATGESSAVDSRDSALYKRVLGHSLRQAPSSPAPHMPPPRTSTVDLTARLSPLGTPKAQISGHGDVDSTTRGQQTAETATTPTMVADRDARRHSFGAGRLASGQLTAGGSFRPHGPLRTATFPDFDTTGAGEAGAVSAGGGPGTSGAAVESGATPAGVSHGGHDAPNWGRLKSSVILMSATLLYAIIAEILVDTVDVVLEGFAIDEKFLGITLFALVPNTTEFLVSFATSSSISGGGNHAG